MANRTSPEIDRLDAFLRSSPVLERVRDACGETPVFLVGGAIRDALCGFPVDDIDLVVEGDPGPLVHELDPAATVHERFGTAELRVGGHPVDIARARTEKYPFPGALPEVTPGSITDDLSRRDFTVNSIAVPLTGSVSLPGDVIDPFNGMRDLESGVLRVLHPESFRDDPTRALRGARYAARFDFDLAPATADLLDTVDLSTISRDRLMAELILISREEQALEALRLISVWGLVPVDDERLALARDAVGLLEQDPWAGAATREEAIFGACFRELDPVLEALFPEPALPSDGVERASRFDPVDLLLARAAGIGWLDVWREQWRWIELEITGADLLAAGIPQGPAVGAGMKAALRQKLDRGTEGLAAELEVALAAARELV
ncbi:MAG: hypothetical protein M3Y45_09990 [Actinomycetota bacterium]|nr:hypothetical protein [Actinomycetota bacterium]